MSTYFQCELGQDNGARTVAWIDEEGAKPGAVVQIIEHGHIDWWHLLNVYPGGIGEELMKLKQRLDRDSLPSIAGKN